MNYHKVCNCGAAFAGTGPAAKLCAKCKADKAAYWREYNRQAVAVRRAASGKIKNPGVGKGGAPLMGSSNPMYKHGKYVFETLRTEIKKERRHCERCQVDLLEATHYMWVVHHKDHNHWNHELSNLELLCKRCHQIEHECHKAFTKVQRLSRKGVRSSERKC